MMEALAGVIIGGIISFFSGYFIEFKKEKKEEKQLKTERLEKLFFNYLKWENIFIIICSYNIKFQQNKLTLESLHKLISESTKEVNIGDLQKEFLVYINLYFPNLAQKYKSLDIARSKISEYFVYEKIDTKNMLRSYDIFLQETQIFKDFIIKESKSIS